MAKKPKETIKPTVRRGPKSRYGKPIYMTPRFLPAEVKEASVHVERAIDTLRVLLEQRVYTKHMKQGSILQKKPLILYDGKTRIRDNIYEYYVRVEIMGKLVEKSIILDKEEIREIDIPSIELFRQLVLPGELIPGHVEEKELPSLQKKMRLIKNILVRKRDIAGKIKFLGRIEKGPLE